MQYVNIRDLAPEPAYVTDWAPYLQLAIKIATENNAGVLLPRGDYPIREGVAEKQMYSFEKNYVTKLVT